MGNLADAHVDRRLNYSSGFLLWANIRGNGKKRCLPVSGGEIDRGKSVCDDLIELRSDKSNQACGLLR
jgi:hypothetical protein